MLAAGLGILVLFSCSGCSSRAHPLSIAFSGLGVAPTAQGLSELLDKLPSLSPDDRRNQLRFFADSAAPAQLKEEAAYVLARDLQLSGAPDDYKEAIERYKQATALMALSNQCSWHTVECAQKLGQEKLVRQTLSNLGQSADKDVGANAEYALGQSYMRTAEHDAARQTFSQVIAQAPDSQYALGCTYYLAQLDLADVAQPQKPPATGGSDAEASQQQPATPPATMDPATIGATIGRAIAAFKHYLQASPTGHFALDIANQLKGMPEFQATSADHNLLARAFYANGDYASALEQWHAAGNTNEWFKQAASLIRLGKTAAGKAALAEGIKNHPASEDVADAAALLCRFLNHDGAVAVWKGVLQRSPRFADVAMYNLATRAPTNEAALQFYRRIISVCQSSAYAPESAWWVGWNQYKSGKSQDALSTLQTAAQRYPEAKAAPRFLFWIGKLYERMGKRDAAKAAYARAVTKAPWHYYAHRAQSRLAALAGGKDPGFRTLSTRQVHWSTDTAADWDFPEPPAELAKQEGPTVELLTELKQWDECLDLVPQNSGLLRGFYLAKLNLPLQAINAAGHALTGRPQPNEGWQLAYPLLYARFIASEAPSKQLDPLLVQALIREESRYNVQAVSSSHAIGLMQLMPGTAYGVAKRLGIPLSGTADIHDPEKNIRMGVDYLSYVLRRFKGNALFAVASYNGGPNAVQHWSAHMPADTDVFVEDIPFRETRDYVRKVFGSYWNYEAIYAHAP